MRYVHIFLVFFYDAKAQFGLGHLIVEVFRSHTVKHTHLVGLLWTSDQLVAEASAYTIYYKHKRRTSCPHRDSKLRSHIRVAADLRLRPHGYLAGLYLLWTCCCRTFGDKPQDSAFSDQRSYVPHTCSDLLMPKYILHNALIPQRL
jgi:hypothetical protein